MMSAAIRQVHGIVSQHKLVMLTAHAIVPVEIFDHYVFPEHSGGSDPQSVTR
jgi:hypothetical protein